MDKDHLDQVVQLAARLRQYNEWRRGAKREQPEPTICSDIDAAATILESLTHQCAIEDAVTAIKELQQRWMMNYCRAQKLPAGEPWAWEEASIAYRSTKGEKAIAPLAEIEESIRDIATEFFRTWYNAPGTNTDQGFDSWWKLNRARFGFGS